MGELQDQPRRKRVARKPSAIQTERNLNLPVAVSAKPTPHIIDALGEIDRRLADAAVHELPDLLHARGQIIQQDEYRFERANQRRIQLAVLYGKIGFSALSLVGGLGLIGTGFFIPGFFLLGGSAAVYVPEYVKDFFEKMDKGIRNAD